MADVAKSGFAHLKWLEPLAVLLPTMTDPAGFTPGRPLMADLQIDYERETARAEFQPTRSIGHIVESWQIVGDAGPMWRGDLTQAITITGDFVLTFGADDVPEEPPRKKFWEGDDAIAIDANDVTWPASSGPAPPYVIAPAHDGTLHRVYTEGAGQLRGREIFFRGVGEDGLQQIFVPPSSRAGTIGDCTSHDSKCIHGLCLWCGTCRDCRVKTRPGDYRLIEPPDQGTSNARTNFIYGDAKVSVGDVDWSTDTVKVALTADSYDPCAVSGHQDCIHGRCAVCEDCEKCHPLPHPLHQAPF